MSIDELSVEPFFPHRLVRHADMQTVLSHYRPRELLVGAQEYPVLIDAGEDYRIGGDGPTVRAVVFECAREVHRKRYVGTGDGEQDEAERRAWNRNIKRATDEGLIAAETADGKKRLWLVKA